MSTTIAHQGAAGAYAELACHQAFPGLTSVPCPTFEDTFAAVRDGAADLAMIPIENSVYGRVADIHQLLPESGLHITAEHFLRVNHHLLVLPGTPTEDLRTVHSQAPALGQCRAMITRRGLLPVVEADTAGSARMVAEAGDRSRAAIASSLAAETYGLQILESEVEDATHNTTRFVVMARVPNWPSRDAAQPSLTTFVFEVRSVPAALYKALGGFATNGVNMTKLESYMVGGRFSQVRFYADVEGHPDDVALKFALEELGYFSKRLDILGVYPQHPFRRDPSQAAGDD